MQARQRAATLARSKIGTVERPTNRVEFNEWYYGSDVSAAWCATYASWVTYNAGAPVPATTSKGFAYVAAGVNWAQAHGLWRPRTYTPQLMDEAVFSFEGQRPDHIELVEDPSKWAGGKGSLVNIGGNTQRPGGSGSQRDGGGVWRRVRGAYLIGFILPPYPADPTPPTPTPDPILEDEPVTIYIPTDDAGNTHDAAGKPLAPQIVVQGNRWTTVTSQDEHDRLVGAGADVQKAKPFAVDVLTHQLAEYHPR